jgi:SPP1 family predicted phage head-tail adaptor
MQAAELRNKPIILQQVTKAADADGQWIETWSAWTGGQANVWASVKPISGREFWLAKEAQARATHRLNILYQPGINTFMRCLLNDGSGRIFHFESILNLDERNEALEILAVEDLARTGLEP